MKEMLQTWRSPVMWGGNAELVCASDVGRECRIWVGQVAGNKGRYEGNAADLAFASDVGWECRIRVVWQRPGTLTIVGRHARLRWAFARVYKLLRLRVHANRRLI